MLVLAHHCISTTYVPGTYQVLNEHDSGEERETNPVVQSFTIFNSKF